MSQQELLTEVAEVLQRIGIEFMLTGSLASSLQGEARATHDIDLLCRLSIDDVDVLVRSFSEDRFYLSRTAVEEAIRSRRMFNLLEVTTSDKVAFWVLTESPFDQSRFSRRQSIDIGGLSIDVSSPEDTILMKLYWSKQSGGSEKQLNDVLRVYELQADVIDRTYVEKWVSELKVGELWQRILDEAEPISPPDQ